MTDDISAEQAQATIRAIAEQQPGWDDGLPAEIASAVTTVAR